MAITFDPTKHCGAKKKTGEGFCTHIAGERTDHVGLGKCWLHGGATPVKHGLRSKVRKSALKDEIQSAKHSPELLSLDEQIAFLKVILNGLLENYEVQREEFNSYMELLEDADYDEDEIPAVRPSKPDIGAPIEVINTLNRVIKTAFDMRFTKRFSVPLSEVDVILAQIVTFFNEVCDAYGVSNQAKVEFAEKVRANIKIARPPDEQLAVAAGANDAARIDSGEGPASRLLVQAEVVESFDSQQDD